MKLTEHFDLSEFTRSATADRLHIDNTIDLSVPSGQSVFKNLKNLCEQILEPLREYVNKPVIISSGYRCPKLNRLVGGVSNSQHQKGEAADIHIPSTKEGHGWLLWIMENTCFYQLIWEKKGSSRWIHVSCKLNLSQNRMNTFKLNV